MMMRQAFKTKYIKEVAMMVEENIFIEKEDVGMFLHVSSVGNKTTRWDNVLRIKMMEEIMK